MPDKVISRHKLIESQAASFVDSSSDITCCRHCTSPQIKKWGKSAGLQRYKCKNIECGKTFNALTGIALYGLRQEDKWFNYLKCIYDSLPSEKSSTASEYLSDHRIQMATSFSKSANRDTN